MTGCCPNMSYGVYNPPISTPASYICNRCGGRGHYVNDCPTNTDPTYDITPDMSYVCKFCKKRGHHYFVFCDKYPDPNSIYRQRLANGFTSEENTSTIHGKSMNDELNSLTFRHTIDRFSSCDDSMERSRTENMAKRENTWDRRLAAIGPKRAFINPQQDSQAHKRDFWLSQADTQKKGDFWSPGVEPLTGDFWTADYEAAGGDFWCRRTASSDQQQKAGIRDVEFFRNLFKNNPGAPKEVVNNPRRRPTALEMWDLNDEKKEAKLDYIIGDDIAASSVQAELDRQIAADTRRQYIFDDFHERTLCDLDDDIKKGTILMLNPDEIVLENDVLHDDFKMQEAERFLRDYELSFTDIVNASQDST